MDIVERLRRQASQQDMLTCEDMLQAADEIERLRAAGDAAFYAMCNQRDGPDEEVFQDAIDDLGKAMSK